MQCDENECEFEVKCEREKHTFLSKKVSSIVKKKITIQEEETLAEEVRNHSCLYINHISLYAKSDPGYKEKEKRKREQNRKANAWKHSH